MSNVKKLVHKDQVDVLAAEWLVLKREEKAIEPSGWKQR